MSRSNKWVLGVMALLSVSWIVAGSFKGSGKLIEQGKTTLLSAETKETQSYGELYSEKGAVILLVSDEKACSCSLGNNPFTLYEAHKDKLNFYTIISGAPSKDSEHFLHSHRDNLAGSVYYDTERTLVARYKPSTETSILFLDKSGNTLALLPGKDIDKSALRLGHVLISQL